MLGQSGFELSGAPRPTRLEEVRLRLNVVYDGPRAKMCRTPGAKRAAMISTSTTQTVR